MTMRTTLGPVATLLGLAACAASRDDAATNTGVEGLTSPSALPSPTGTGALAPWGGPDPAAWRPEAIVANASSAALNEALARADVVDATAAVPVKMRSFGFEEFGDGQVEAAPSFESWTAKTPPFVAVLAKLRDGRLEVRMRFSAVPGTDASVVVRTTTGGRPKVVTLVGERTGPDLTATWEVPAELGWDSTFAKTAALVRPASQTDWFPLAFRVPTRLSRDLDVTMPPELQRFADGHDILDHEDVGLSHVGAEPTVFGRLQHHTFSMPYATSTHADMHGVFFDASHTRIAKAVGRGFSFTPAKAPFKLQYLCFEGRDPAREVTPTGGVPSGAGWHEMHDKPAETLVNDLEDQAIPVGSAWTPVPASELPSGAFAFGLSEVATMRLLRPGEAFVTPRSGTALDANGAAVLRANFHRVYAAGPAPRCIEVWQHPCTPTNDMNFTCATTPVDFLAQNVTTAADERVFVLGNVPELGGWNPTRAVALTAGPSGWRASVSLPQSVAIELKFIKKNEAGHVVYEAGANRTLDVPVAPRASVTGSFR